MPMKTLHVIPRMVPSSDGIFVGGSINALLALVRATRDDHDSIIYTHTDIGLKTRFNKAKLRDADILVEENRYYPGSLLYGLYFLIRGLCTIINNKAWNSDVIHGHSGFAPYALVTMLAGKILRKPSVHTLYCPVNVQGFIKTRLYYHSLILVDSILAMSNNVKESLLKIGIPERKIVLLPPFIDTDKFQPDNRSDDTRNDLGASPEEPVILFVGNLKDSKGLDILVDALRLFEKNKSFRFVFTLELKNKEFESRLELIKSKLQKNELLNRTVQLDIIDNMPALVASVDLLVVPYRDTDGPSDYPIVLLEAMASGTPAVGSRVGGIPELIQNGVTGILVEPENPHELALAIQELLNNHPHRIKLGDNARNKCIEMFPNENIRNVIGKVYNELLNSMRGAK
jgi:glycosyltransferase involved in cell wall biosynthesis